MATSQVPEIQKGPKTEAELQQEIEELKAEVNRMLTIWNKAFPEEMEESRRHKIYERIRWFLNSKKIDNDK